STPKWWRYPPIKPAEAAQIAQLPEVQAVIMADNDNRVLYVGSQQAEANILGRGAQWVLVTGAEIYEGRSFTNIEGAAGGQVVVLCDKAAGTLFGGQDPLGRYTTIAGQRYTIIGIYHPPPNLFAATAGSTAVIPYTAYRRYVARFNGWARFLVRPQPNVTV